MTDSPEPIASRARAVERLAIAFGAIYLSAYAISVRADEMPANWAGFSSSTAAADKRLVDEIYKMKWWDACIVWGREMRAKGNSRREVAFRYYLESEHMLAWMDRTKVYGRDIEIGMSECGVFASRGRPDAINQTETARGRTAQFVYRNANLYVYTEPSPVGRFNIVRSYQH